MLIFLNGHGSVARWGIAPWSPKVILLWSVCDAQTPHPWAVEKQLCSHYFYFWRSAWGNRNMICRLWFLKYFFFSLFFFFLGLLCLHRKFWIGIFVSFYSKFLLSHPPNLEPETTILPHPNSAGRPFDELGMSYSPKCSFLSFRQLWQSSDLWSW